MTKSLLLLVVCAVYFTHVCANVSNVHVIEWPWRNWQNGPPCPLRHHQQLVPQLDTSLLRSALEEVNLLFEEEAVGLAQAGMPCGLAVSIVYGQQVLLEKGYGKLNKSTTQPPTANTIFDVGSVTKIFTSLGLFHSVDKGLVNLDDKVTKFFNAENPPAFTINNPYSSDGADAVTLRSLAAQSSGLPREAYCGVYPVTAQCLSDTMATQLNFEALSKIGLLFSPMTNAHYSNLGLALLGRCLERVWNVKYEDYMVNNIFLPLGMNSTGFEYTAEVKENMITAYAIGQFPNGTYYTVPSSASTTPLGWSAPCGGLYTSTADLVKFFQFIFNNTDSPVISQQMLDQYFTPAIPLPDGVSGFGSGTFEIYYANNYTTFTKGGVITMAASLSIVPELKLGASVMINLNSGAQTDKMNAQIMKIMVPAIEAALNKSQVPLPLPPNYQDLLGHYGFGIPTILSMEEGAPGTGVLKGTINVVGEVYFVWDSSQDYSNSTAFRYSAVQDSYLSCMGSAGSNNAIAYFSYYNGKQVVSLPDQNVSFYNIPKK